MNNSTTSLGKKPYISRHGWAAPIGSRHVSLTERGTFQVSNPATGEVLATLCRMGARETQEAIDAAERALPEWRDRPARSRAIILKKFAEEIIKHEDELATLLTLEQGKPYLEALAEVRSASAALEWNAEEARRTYGDIIPHVNADCRMHVIRQGVGVTAGITPWNFPIGMPARKSAPALAAGCTMILKPAEATPLCTLAFVELGQKAGIPEGVLNIVLGASEDSIEIGKTLCSSSTVRKLSFTGSTNVGRILMRQCADNVKRLSLELGGNAPFIVFEDADIDKAVAAAIQAKFRNAGQVCVAVNRILVHRSIHDIFVDKLTAAVQTLKVGNGLETGVQVGPLIDIMSMKKVQSHVDDAVSKGATLHTGGCAHSLGRQFFQPTVLSGMTSDMIPTIQETFGPLAAVGIFDTDEQAVTLANSSEYGLAAYAYTKNHARAMTLSEKLDFGMVAINTTAIANEAAPFGGMKQSGFGREGGRDGILDWMDVKYIAHGGLGVENRG